MIATILFCDFILMQAQEDTPYLDIVGRNEAIRYLSEKWQLTHLEQITYPSVFNNYIARAYSETYKHDVIIKIGESNHECKALQYLQGDGMVHILNYDHEYCALLLEYIPSQGTLADFSLLENDDTVINAFINLFKKIHRTPRNSCSAHFKSIYNELSLLHSREFTKIPEILLKKARQICEKLFISDEPHYLLHCDLHCRNILQHEDSFIAIDPWASMGPLEYEAASFLTSPTDLLLAQNNVHEILQNRLNRLSTLLHLNKKLLKECSFIRLILLACLCESRNKNDDWINEFIQVAEIIDQLNENE